MNSYHCLQWVKEYGLIEMDYITTDHAVRWIFDLAKDGAYTDDDLEMIEETVFGYITDADQIDDRNEALAAMALPEENPSEEDIELNRQKVIEIVALLKDKEWNFASSTYGYINADDSTMEVIQNDTDKWLKQVASLTGKVDMLVYPNGNFIKGSDSRCVYLKNLGFRIFFGVGPYPYYTFGDNYLYMDRAMMNGDTLRNVNYSRLFTASTIYDSARKNNLAG